MTKEPRIQNEERIVSSIMVLEKLDCHIQKNETGPLSYTIHKNQLQMDERLKCKTWNHKTPRRKHGG